MSDTTPSEVRTMTSEEMKKALAQGGVSCADIEKIAEKYDAEIIIELVENSSDPNNAIGAVMFGLSFGAIAAIYGFVIDGAAGAATMGLAGLTGGAIGGAALGGILGILPAVAVTSDL